MREGARQGGAFVVARQSNTFDFYPPCGGERVPPTGRESAPSMLRHFLPCSFSASRKRRCSSSVQRSRALVMVYGFRVWEGGPSVRPGVEAAKRHAAGPNTAGLHARQLKACAATRLSVAGRCWRAGAAGRASGLLAGLLAQSLGRLAPAPAVGTHLDLLFGNKIGSRVDRRDGRVTRTASRAGSRGARRVAARPGPAGTRRVGTLHLGRRRHQASGDSRRGKSGAVSGRSGAAGLHLDRPSSRTPSWCPAPATWVTNPALHAVARGQHTIALATAPTYAPAAASSIYLPRR